MARIIAFLKMRAGIPTVNCHLLVELIWTFTQMQPLTLGAYLNYLTHLKLVHLGLQVTPFAKETMVK